MDRFLSAPGPSLMVLGLLGLLVGCGGFDNTPFGEGSGELQLVFEGKKAGEQSWVAVRGLLSEDDPQAISTVMRRPDKDGRVRFKDLAAGDLQILASDGNDKAVVLNTRLYANRKRSLTLSLIKAFRLKGRVQLSDGPLRWATVTLLDLPWLSTELTSGGGQFEFSGLPPGCYDVEIAHPGYGSELHRLCGASGETAELEVYLGPTATGSGASCQPCASGADCASGACVSDEMADGPDAARVCAVLCQTQSDCPQAFSCQRLEGTAASACLPVEASCSAFEAHRQRKSCVNDEGCSTGGICLGGHCRLACSDEGSCPGNESCLPGPQPEPIFSCN